MNWLCPILYDFDIFWLSELWLLRLMFVLFVGCGPIKSNIAYSILLMVSPDCMIVFSLLVSSMVIASLLLNSRKKRLLSFGKAKKSTWKRDYFGKKSRWCKDQVSRVSFMWYRVIRSYFVFFSFVCFCACEPGVIVHIYWYPFIVFVRFHDNTIEVFSHIQVHL